ncbi:hypothetical protein CSCA_0178 [Clostridium scatologenes]|uniref:Uncharacterized protein n=1 Tax=Clostridium scatologenes TaxID=1548 RepID=A0A0E3M728_CLOSL|nr:hypothetical protein CSCA_0178 [Clostridium scatologenes]
MFQQGIQYKYLCIQALSFERIYPFVLCLVNLIPKGNIIAASAF